MQDLWRLSAADLAALVKARKVSAREAASAGLSRLDAVNPRLNAVIDHRPEDVLKQADAVDAAIARGEDPGVLAGVPVTIKANVDQEGFATTNGLKLQHDLTGDVGDLDDGLHQRRLGAFRLQHLQNHLARHFPGTVGIAQILAVGIHNQLVADTGIEEISGHA